MKIEGFETSPKKTTGQLDGANGRAQSPTPWPIFLPIWDIGYVWNGLNIYRKSIGNHRYFLQQAHWNSES